MRISHFPARSQERAAEAKVAEAERKEALEKKAAEEKAKAEKAAKEKQEAEAELKAAPLVPIADPPPSPPACACWRPPRCRAPSPGLIRLLGMPTRKGLAYPPVFEMRPPIWAAARSLRHVLICLGQPRRVPARRRRRRERTYRAWKRPLS